VPVSVPLPEPPEPVFPTGRAGPQLGQMRPFDLRNCAGQADDLTAWGITVGDWADYRLFSGLFVVVYSDCIHSY